MIAQDLMTADPAVVTPLDHTAHAASLMTQFDVGMLPVVDDRVQRRLVGVITDRDIVIRCLGQGHHADCLIKDHMSENSLVMVTVNTTVETIAAQMERYQVRRLPVIESVGKRVVGVITLADIARGVGGRHPELVQHLTERIFAPRFLVT